jgi:WD40 repeat protein
VVVLHLEGDGQPTLLELPKENVTVSGFCDLNAGPMPFSSDGSRVTAGTSGRVACVWDANDGRLLHALGHECACHRSIASFTPSGHYIIVQQYDSVEAELWEAETGKMQCRLPHSSAFHVPLRYLPFPSQAGTAEYAVVGMGASDYSWPLRDNMVSEWRITTGGACSEFRLPGKQSFQRIPTSEGAVVHWAQRAEQDDISLDSDWVLRLEDGVVRVFARVEAMEAPEPSTEQGSSFTADRRIVYTAEGQRLLDTVTNQALALFGLQDQCRLSQNGRHLVTIVNVENKPVVRLWDARTGELRFTINDYSQPIVNLQFQSGPARLLIFARDHTVRLWSLETGTEVARATINAPDESWYEAASTPDGTKVAFVTSGQLHVWHTDHGMIVHARTTLYAKDPRFSADGSWLLAGNEDVARIWDTTTMEVMGEFPWHFSSILFGDLSPDRKLAATCGMDHYIRMWEAPGGREITRWKISSRHSRWPLRFSEDGAFLYCPDGQRRIVGVEQLISLAKTRVFRTLSPVERRLFLGERET